MIHYAQPKVRQMKRTMITTTIPFTLYCLPEFIVANIQPKGDAYIIKGKRVYDEEKTLPDDDIFHCFH